MFRKQGIGLAVALIALVGVAFLVKPMGKDLPKGTEGFIGLLGDSITAIKDKFLVANADWVVIEDSKTPPHPGRGPYNIYKVALTSYMEGMDTFNNPRMVVFCFYNEKLYAVEAYYTDGIDATHSYLDVRKQMELYPADNIRRGDAFIEWRTDKNLIKTIYIMDTEVQDQMTDWINKHS